MLFLDGVEAMTGWALSSFGLSAKLKLPLLGSQLVSFLIGCYDCVGVVFNRFDGGSFGDEAANGKGDDLGCQVRFVSVVDLLSTATQVCLGGLRGSIDFLTFFLIALLMQF